MIANTSPSMIKGYKEDQIPCIHRLHVSQGNFSVCPPPAQNACLGTHNCWKKQKRMELENP